MEVSALSSHQEHIIQMLIRKNPSLNEDLLRKAVLFITDAHKGQFRKSGMPYTEHPLEVAKILADLQLDTASVLAGLLHDVVEDTPHTLKELTEMFGEETAFMVDAVTKISAVQKQKNKDAEKAETYRKLVNAMAKDPRVLLIKIADRLHNMRTMRYMKPEKRQSIAQETLDIYVPLTHRFGLYKFKSELEDLSFKYVNPVEYQKIVDALIEKKNTREAYVKSVIGPLQFKLALEELDCTIQGRTKNIYSIYSKMQRRNCSFEEIFDIFAVRIIVNTISDCYLALGYVHNLWAPLQSRFKDYIATPKPNLYQSIHTTVIGPENKMVEVQIRTQDMDMTAEKGFAAHWAYKMETGRSGEELGWLEQMAKLQAEIPDSMDFLNFLKADLKPKGMPVFTPKGDSVELPPGATVLDFAFAVHTELGLHCIGAKINNKVFNIDSVVPNGATVQIIKSPSQEPGPEWLDIVKTAKAKQELRRWMRTSFIQQAQNLGKEIWERELRRSHIKASDIPNEQSICKHFNLKNIETFYEKLGQGEMILPELQKFLTSFSKIKENYEPSVLLYSKENSALDPFPLPISQNSSLLIHFAKCCSPIPGEEITGVLVPHQGIEVHNTGCSKLEEISPEQLIAVTWDGESSRSFETHLSIDTDNRKGITIDVLNELSNANVFLVRMSVASVKYSGRIRLTFKAFRKTQVEKILMNIKRIEGVREVRKQ
ncbi:MAG: bifunctional (p)ppGpp synthetase/guanosine-3',5'-bis(diphosphate) 3'-pyrophosphohydrolase [Fibrobacteraceae bacterium]|jgi:GTP pyrophosphokinase|nr:bifunctional (p)ppGpp synthetase/guanosine-3',5'-bis(diphosphate) 3'-pyrophosphohydrolase [Fibrobacteraceae bacterium]